MNLLIERRFSRRERFVCFYHSDARFQNRNVGEFHRAVVNNRNPRGHHTALRRPLRYGFSGYSDVDLRIVYKRIDFVRVLRLQRVCFSEGIHAGKLKRNVPKRLRHQRHDEERQRMALPRLKRKGLFIDEVQPFVRNLYAADGLAAGVFNVEREVHAVDGWRSHCNVHIELNEHHSQRQ
ncbi:hypothetical protein SDC9_159759 [bioreactor metagenome]|uniref:Uncharacterized protein n=1 Tax=bioreactor metagenome TaxID=1076179 RepID=A0A645FDJ8_9ZZZZ